MKKNYVLIILASAILGILLGIIFRDHNREKENYINNDNIILKEIKVLNKDIKGLTDEKENLEEEYEVLKNEYEDIEKVKVVDDVKEKLSYTDVAGRGLVIKVDASNEEIGNIANFVDYNKILVNITNELKIYGAEFIAINEQRINQYSEITLAGSHININSIPIAPPYEIKCIGNKLSDRYKKEENNYIENIQKNYPLKVNVKVVENIELKKINIPNKLKYIKGE